MDLCKHILMTETIEVSLLFLFSKSRAFCFCVFLLLFLFFFLKQLEKQNCSNQAINPLNLSAIVVFFTYKSQQFFRWCSDCCSFYPAFAMMLAPLVCQGNRLGVCALLISEKLKGNSVWTVVLYQITSPSFFSFLCIVSMFHWF